MCSGCYHYESWSQNVVLVAKCRFFSKLATAWVQAGSIFESKTWSPYVIRRGFFEMRAKTRKKKAKGRKEMANKAILARIVRARRDGERLQDVYAELAVRHKRKPGAIARYCQRHPEGEKKAHGGHFFTEEEESCLLDTFLAFYDSDKDLTTNQAVILVMEWKDIKSKEQARSLIRRFVNRHATQLRWTNPKSLASARKDMSILDSIEEYITALNPENSAAGTTLIRC
jgi:hypothetical protein